jgi:hypothetical protein
VGPDWRWPEFSPDRRKQGDPAVPIQ